MTDRRYPLHWPEGWKRTRYPKRSSYAVRHDAGFTEERAKNEMLHALKLLGARNVIVSTNIELRLDGLPYSNRRRPTDVGVAVYWTQDNQDRCIACDMWETMGENYRAIYLAVESLRQLSRCGASEILDRAFRGFTALPANASRASWRAELGFGPSDQVTKETVLARYRELAKTRHPDVGGTNEEFVRLCGARDDALKEVG